MAERRRGHPAGGAAADNDDVFADEVSRRAVVMRVQLLPLEQRPAGIVGNIGRVPGAGAVDDTARRQGDAIRLDPEAVFALRHRRDLYRPVDVQVEGLFVRAEIRRHCRRRLDLVAGNGDGVPECHPRQVVDAVHRAERQGGPAILPRAAGTGRTVQHDEILVRDQTRLAQMIGRRQARLAGADDDDIDLDGDARCGGRALAHRQPSAGATSVRMASRT